MGYSGLHDYSDSDLAFDLAGFAFDAVGKELRKGLKETGNEFNTSGFVNVALFNEAYLYPVERSCTEWVKSYLWFCRRHGRVLKKNLAPA